MSLKQFAIAFDQLVNTLIDNGYADETISARCYRLRHKSKFWWYMRKIVDGIFFWQHQHCWQAYVSEMERKQMPKEYRFEGVNL